MILYAAFIAMACLSGFFWGLWGSKPSVLPAVEADKSAETYASSAKLKEPLTRKSRFPSFVPESFLERDWEFRRKHPVSSRERGFCKIRESVKSAWVDAYCTLVLHQVKLYRVEDDATEPATDAFPMRKLELVGAHLASQRQRELSLDVPHEGTLLLMFPSEEERDQWMVALGKVPGLFRRVSDYYQVGASWGQGATCHVQECWGKFTGQHLALKSRANASREATQSMHNELRILQLCAKHPHPAIPCLYDFFFDEHGSIELVMDLMAGGELFDYVATRKRLRESEARHVFRSVVEGVAHLHSLGIAHRDLKPQNLMYLTPAEEGGQVKIMDFDLAKVDYAPQWRTDTPCGTVHYMAPEIVRHQKYSQSVDMWSLGVILYILLSGRMPFDGKDRQAITKAIEGGEYSMQSSVWERISVDAKDLLRRMLCLDPALRITAAEALAHPWLAATPHPSPVAVEGVGAAAAELGGGAAPEAVEGKQRASGGGGEADSRDEDAELPSPAVLRDALSLSVRGRQILAEAVKDVQQVGAGGGELRGNSPPPPAAEAVAESPPETGGIHIKKPRNEVAVAGTPPQPARALSIPRVRSPLRDMFDYDLEAVRQQAAAASPNPPPLITPLQSSASRQRLARLLPQPSDDLEAWGHRRSPRDGPLIAAGGLACAAGGAGAASRGGSLVGGSPGSEWGGAGMSLGARSSPGGGLLGGSPGSEWGNAGGLAAWAGRRESGGRKEGAGASQSAELDVLRSQLEVIGTAAGVQDGRVMAAEGRDVGPTSPTVSGRAAREGGVAQGGVFQLDQFEGLEAEAVEEEEDRARTEGVQQSEGSQMGGKVSFDDWR